MKTKYILRPLAVIALTGLIITGISSCKKYLDVKPVSAFDPGYVFGNIPNARNAVLGAYASMTGDNGYGIRLSMYYPYDNDEMMGQGGTPYPDGERRDIAHYNVNANNTQLAAPFNQLYQGIERSNLCIYYIPKMELYTSGSAGEKKELKRLHGEALTLRAQYYLELIRNWGDVPAHFEPAFEQTNFFQPKTDRDTIYKRILADLAIAETLVPWRTEAGTNDERITQGAVRALRARIALFAGGYSLRQDGTMKRVANYKDFYQIAKDECALLMTRRDQHKLNSSFQAVWKDAIDAHKLEPNGEVMFEVAMSGGSSGAGDSKLGYYNGPRYNNLGNSALTILPTFFYAFDSTDTRRDVTCAPYNIGFKSSTSTDTINGRSLQTMVDGKFRRDWIVGPDALRSAAQYFAVNWPVIRFSDVLLMFAEADNEINGNPSTAAINAFNEVRLRAFNNNATLIGVTPTTYTAFFDAIVKERMLEFGGEGIRKYDLIRWNLLGTKIAATKATLTAMSTRTAPYNLLPDYNFYKINSPTIIWLNSFYKPNPTGSTAPAGWVRVDWVRSGIGTTLSTYFGVSFTPGKSELLPIPQAAIDANPSLKQNPGYQ
jgi:starch-binding outer membrane protein, SusD/RagB family